MWLQFVTLDLLYILVLSIFIKAFSLRLHEENLLLIFRLILHHSHLIVAEEFIHLVIHSLVACTDLITNSPVPLLSPKSIYIL